MELREPKEILVNEEIEDMQSVKKLLKPYDGIPVKYVDRETANSIFGDIDEFGRQLAKFEKDLIGKRVIVTGPLNARNKRVDDRFVITDLLV
jgi:hypothetical protein